MSANPQIIEFPQQRPFRRQGMGWVYSHPDLTVRLFIDRIVSKSEDLTGELLIESVAPGTPKHVHRARVNLLSTRSRSEVANYLVKANPTILPGRPWAEILEVFYSGVVEAERRGEAFVIAGKRTTRPPSVPDKVEGFLPGKQPTSLYGPGGSGKSYISVGVCAALSAGVDFARLRVLPGKPLYLDWEDELERFEERLWKVSRGMGLDESAPVAYRTCRGPLHTQLYEIARYIDGEGIDFVVVDSVIKACGTSDHGTYESVAMRFLEALRQLGPITALLIDHVDASSVRNGERAGKSYGSIMKQNGVRMEWEIKKIQDIGALTSTVALYHQKTNHTKVFDPIGFEIDFSDDDMVTISPTSVYEAGALAEKLSQKDRIANLLRRGPMAAIDIAHELGILSTAKGDAAVTVRAVLHREKRMFVQLPDARWGLLGAGEVRQPPKVQKAAWDSDLPDELPFD